MWSGWEWMLSHRPGYSRNHLFGYCTQFMADSGRPEPQIKPLTSKDGFYPMPSCDRLLPDRPPDAGITDPR
jgi:hypothetical protein